MGQELPRFEELFLHHLDAAYNLARWIVESDQDAQDVVQEAYARALENFSGFRGVNPRACPIVGTIMALCGCIISYRIVNCVDGILW
jgi:hypothetical protein